MNIEELNTQIEYLKETKNLIKEQLIAKGQPVDDNTTFREYVDNMIDLIDTTDADAIDSDIVENKTAYVNGQKVTGTLEIVDAISIDNSGNTDTNLMLMNIDNIPSIVVGADINDLYGVKEVVEDGVGLEIIAPQSQLADVIGLTTDKIKAGETILGITGNVVELNGDTETVTPTTSQQIITPTSPKNGFTQVTVNAVTSAIDNNIQASNIKNGVTILGVQGTYSGIDTSDANATSNDMASGKTAYVNEQKVTGSVSVLEAPFEQEWTSTSVSYEDGKQGQYLSVGTPVANDILLRAGARIFANINASSVASAIGLSANIIKSGETILGIQGTYAGSTMKEYSSVTDMNNDIVNIAEGELVKVVASGVTTYYIKETISGTATMTKLVKESETISPQDFEEAEDQIGDLFGEGENN